MTNYGIFEILGPVVRPKKIKTTFSIEEVSEIAGVNSFTLRNWEDRYGLFTPARDGKGRRVFSEADTIRAVVAAELTNRHHKIGKIASDLQNCSDPHLILRENIEGESFRQRRSEAVTALLEFNAELFHQTFLHLLGNYDVEFIADHFFYPIFRELEELRLSGKITEFQSQFCQHHLSARIARLNGGMRVGTNRDSIGRVLLSGFPENLFEDSTLILQLVLERAGWQVIYGGPNIVMSELEDTIQKTNAEMLILVGNNLSILQFGNHDSVLKKLSIPTVIGGRLALKLLAEGRTSSEHIELSNLRPGPFARLLKYKLVATEEA